MEQIIEYLKQTYAPLGIIVYGSFADGSNNADSDFDVLIITESDAVLHDNTVIDGIMLDAFVYPQVFFEGEFDCKEYLQLCDGIIVYDSVGAAAKLQNVVREYADNIQPKTYEENKTNVAWCEKMLLRAARGDSEGYFRWHWLLTESLEIYCDVLGIRYLGPKKSIKRMRQEDPESASIYEKALVTFDYSNLAEWVVHLKTLLK